MVRLYVGEEGSIAAGHQDTAVFAGDLAGIFGAEGKFGAGDEVDAAEGPVGLGGLVFGPGADGRRAAEEVGEGLVGGFFFHCWMGLL